MTLLPRLVLAASVAFTPGAALAGASSGPFGFTPDPALQTETPAQLQSRIRRACETTQSRIQGAAQAAVGRGCACYAGRVMRTLDAGEIAAYRATAVFNETARAKAFAALDSCRLRRPA